MDIWIGEGRSRQHVGITCDRDSVGPGAVLLAFGDGVEVITTIISSELIDDEFIFWGMMKI